MDITYRKAQYSDCPIVAEYIYYASDGLLDYLFKDAIPDITVTQLLTYGLEDVERHNSYVGVIIAECNRQVIGMLQAYSTIHHQIDDEMRAIIPGEKLEQLNEFYSSRIDNSLLINAMYVDERFRRQGVASQLISLAREAARTLGFDKLSLFVLADNTPAQKLYKSTGFQTEKEVTFNDADKINHTGGIDLMACDI